MITVDHQKVKNFCDIYRKEYSEHIKIIEEYQKYHNQYIYLYNNVSQMFNTNYFKQSFNGYSDTKFLERLDLIFNSDDCIVNSFINNCQDIIKSRPWLKTNIVCRRHKSFIQGLFSFTPAYQSH